MLGMTGRSSFPPGNSRLRLKCCHKKAGLTPKHNGRRDPEQGRLVFLTNHHKLGATTVAAIYKDRWQVELFFKALKQNLRIKTFVGTSSNAVRTQVWAALIAMLLRRYLQLRAKFSWSLSNLAALLRQQLFVYRDAWQWLDELFQPPPGLPQTAIEQLALPLAARG